MNRFKTFRASPSEVNIGHLVLEARQGGLIFVDRLLDDWISGSNRFDKEGEIFLFAAIEDEIVAVGGLNQDPYTTLNVARLRHVYVSENFRGIGVGRKLVESLIAAAGDYFPSVRLRSSDARADKFYEALGFERVEQDRVTHVLALAT